MPNCKTFLPTEVERKHVRRSARFQQHEDASCHRGIFPPQRKATKKFRHSDRNIRRTCTIVCHRKKNSVVLFKRGDFRTCDEPRPGRPKTVTSPEIIEQIHELILKYSRILANSITEELGILRKRVEPIIQED